METSLADIIRDIDCVQETQQHSVTIDFNWNIDDIVELIGSKRPGEKIESEQFSYAKRQSASPTDKSCLQCKCAIDEKPAASAPSLLLNSTLLPLQTEMSCELFLRAARWRLELSRSLDNPKHLALSLILMRKNHSTEQQQQQSIEHASIDLKCSFYLMNGELNDTFEKKPLDIEIDLKKFFDTPTTGSKFVVDKFVIDKFCRLDDFLIWLNRNKSDDFCLLGNFKLYGSRTTATTPMRSVSKSSRKVRSHLSTSLSSSISSSSSPSPPPATRITSSVLLLNYKHAWTIKSWKNFLMCGGATSHTFMNETDISNVFGSPTNRSANNDDNHHQDEIKFGKFRSKLFGLSSDLSDDEPMSGDSLLGQNRFCPACYSSVTSSKLIKALNKNKIETQLKNVKWKLQLYPNGYNGEYRNNLSLFVNFSQLSDELAQFCSPRSQLSRPANIEENFYDTDEQCGLMLLIKSNSKQQQQQHNDESSVERSSKKSSSRSNSSDLFVKASFQISILDANGKKVDKCQSEKQLFELHGSWGYKEWMSTRDLLNLKQKYLTGDNSLKLNCKIILYYTLTCKSNNLIENSSELRKHLSCVELSDAIRQPLSQRITTKSEEATRRRSSKLLNKSLDSVYDPLKQTNSVLYDMRRLLKQSTMHDLVVQAPCKLDDDGDEGENRAVTKFKAHKLILAMRSEVFERMFQNSDLAENHSTTKDLNTLNIVDFDAFIVEIFLNYLYTDTLEVNFNNPKFDLKTNGFDRNLLLGKRVGKVKSTNDSNNNNSNDDNDEEEEEENGTNLIKCEVYTHLFIELFKIADKYCVHRLKQISEYQLCRLINVENTVELLILAYMHDSSRLKRVCYHFLARHVSSIITQPSWLYLEKNYPNLLAEAFRVLYYKQQQQQQQPTNDSRTTN